MKKLLLPLLISSFLIATAATGQIVISAGSLDYSQNFNKATFDDDFALAGTGNPLLWDKGQNPSLLTQWGNNSTFSAWTRQVSVGGQTNRGDKDFIGEMKGGTLRFGLAGDGGTWGTPTTDGALGIVMQGADGSAAFGVVFEVDTGLTLSGANISYTGEQWFRGTASETMNFQYKVIDSFAFSGFLINDETGWTDVDSLDFTSVVVGGSVAKINGNLVGNQATISDSITFSADAGQAVAFRWQYTSDAAGAQAGLFVDDFSVSFTAVPEPAHFAALSGVLALWWVVRRRRRLS